jgi:hypothetical protein
MSLNEIKECKYISSVGLLKSLDELEMITYGDGIIDLAHRVTYNFSKISNGFDGICIYIKFQYIREFFTYVFSSINYKFILVTGDGDETMPNDIFSIDQFNTLINNDKIIHWYSVNCIESLHPKFSLIPIGVNFHSSSFGEFCGWHRAAISPLEQESEIQKIKDNSLHFYERELKCYSNFHFVTYPEFGNPRKDAIEKINPDLVFYEPTFLSRLETWENQSKCAFVLSPMGHGMDCHRTWEALILGCIVVVKRSPLDSLYEDLPVLIVDDWSDINEELLSDTVEKFKNINFNYDRITTKYWVDKIKSNINELIQ